jgi:hypothetical protein
VLEVEQAKTQEALRVLLSGYSLEDLETMRDIHKKYVPNAVRALEESGQLPPGRGRFRGPTAGVELEVFVRREDAERFIEEERGDDPELASLRIEEHKLEAGGLN